MFSCRKVRPANGNNLLCPISNQFALLFVNYDTRQTHDKMNKTNSFKNYNAFLPAKEEVSFAVLERKEKCCIVAKK